MSPEGDSSCYPEEEFFPGDACLIVASTDYGGKHRQLGYARCLLFAQLNIRNPTLAMQLVFWAATAG